MNWSDISSKIIFWNGADIWISDQSDMEILSPDDQSKILQSLRYVYENDLSGNAKSVLDDLARNDFIRISGAKSGNFPFAFPSKSLTLAESPMVAFNLKAIEDIYYFNTKGIFVQ
jgi:hypothetical protein